MEKDKIEKFFIIARSRKQCLKFAKKKRINPIKCFFCKTVKEAEEEMADAERMNLPIATFNILNRG